MGALLTAQPRGEVLAELQDAARAVRNYIARESHYPEALHARAASQDIHTMIRFACACAELCSPLAVALVLTCRSPRWPQPMQAPCGACP